MTRITDEKLIEDLQRVSIELRKANIAMDDYREHGDHAIDTVLDRFGSWNTAKRKAGLPVTARNVSEQELLFALLDLYDDLGRAPTEDEMDAKGPYSSTTYQRKFGSWLVALRAATDVFPEFTYRPAEHTPGPATA